MSRIAVIYYSAYGHVYEMAKATADRAERFGSEVRLRRIPEMEA